MKNPLGVVHQREKPSLWQDSWASLEGSLGLSGAFGLEIFLGYPRRLVVGILKKLEFKVVSIWKYQDVY